MGFMFCDLHVSLKYPSSGDINSSNLSCCRLFLFCCEIDFMLSLSVNNQADVIEAFNTTSIYIYMIYFILIILTSSKW